jgi:chitodextrinase
MIPTSDDGAYYGSRESLVASQAPALVIGYDEPAPDTTAPSVPTGLAANATAPDRVELSWTASTDDTGVAGYTVYRDGVSLGTATGTSFADTSATAGTTYAYAVDAVDAAGNRSARTEPVSVTTPSAGGSMTVGPDADAYVSPDAPTTNYGLAGAIQVDTSPVFSSYLRFVVPAGVGAVTQATLKLYVTNASANGGTIWTVGSTTWTETGLNWNNKPATTASVGPIGTAALGTWVSVDLSSRITAAGTYSLAILGGSTDGVYYASRQNADVSHRPQLVLQVANPPAPDIEAPTVPTGLVATPSAGKVGLSWTASTDAVGVAGYTVYRNGTAVTTVTGTTYSDTGLVAGTTYSYEVEAVDAAGNRSARTAAVSARVPGVPITVGADADAYVHLNENRNHGTGDLKVKDSDRTYLKFTVPSTFGPVSSAVIRLWVKNGSSNGGTIHVVTDSSWTEMGLTWFNKPAAGTSVRTLGAVAKDTMFSIDVSSAITGPGTYSFVIITTSGDDSVYASRGDGTVSRRPQLVLTPA